MKRFALLAALTASAASAEPVEIKVAPEAGAYLNAANPRRGQFDLMLHSILVRADAAVKLTGLRVDYEKDGAVRASRTLDLAAAFGATAEFAGMLEDGFDTFLRAQLLAEGGLEAFAGPGTTLAHGPALAAGEAVLAPGTFQTLAFAPDRLVVVATYREGDKEGEVRLPVTVRRPSSAIPYRFPLDGMWIMRGLPSALGHHRWIPGNEFAVDLFRVGADGAAADGDELEADNNYGYGAPVHAAADGEVVLVIADQVQDRRAQWILPGETVKEARARISEMNMRKMLQDFRGSQAGNLVTLRHTGADGSVEYSNYAHLKAGSVRVTVGQVVKTGDVLGEVGDTGDSSAVHLHFQVNEGPDPFFSASKPFRFDDLEESYEGQDPGLFVRGGA